MNIVLEVVLNAQQMQRGYNTLTDTVEDHEVRIDAIERTLRRHPSALELWRLCQVDQCHVIRVQTLATCAVTPCIILLIEAAPVLS